MVDNFGQKFYEREHKPHICMALFDLFQCTDAGADIKGLHYDPKKETVEVYGEGGRVRQSINVACDSGWTMIKDVINGLKL